MADELTDEERARIRHDFAEAVNMTPAELERWLGTEESKSVGWADGHNKTDASGPESVGHHEGGRIVEIKRKKVAELDDADFGDMRKVTGYVHRHMAQGGPADDKAHSRWRYSLMNWGHDPLKR